MIFKNDAAQFVTIRTYARWSEENKRRETWKETVARFVKFITDERGDKIPGKVLIKIQNAIENLEVMPSMRALWAAGDAAKASNVTMYNCSFIAVDSIDAFSECLYILCCGTGVGFSVENKYISNLPIVNPKKQDPSQTFYIPDTKEGWSDSVKTLITRLYHGLTTDFDYSLIRPKGSRLKTMGGRASGPEPLILLHGFIRELFNKAQGRKLSSLECHDIMNKIAEIVVVGGVRRSSEISLSDLNDKEMRHAKDWPFPNHRAMANNSAVYYEKPTAVEFLKEWSSLASSGTGERGISNLGSARKMAPKRRKGELIQGFNPCHEIALRDKEFCNLSSVIIRPDDDLDSLLEKVETATWIGVIQASFTYFPYLRKEWKENCDEECLLGVSLSGQMDNPEVLTPDALKALKSRALKVATKAAKIMGINTPAAITCVKPEGTSSQVTSSGSGLHTWYSEYMIRRYRISDNDPLLKMLKSQNFPMSPENGQTEENANTWVVSFPIKAPKGAIVKDDMTALDQLEHYKKIQTYWCEHNASATVYCKDSEWFDVGNWVYKNWDIVNGLSFLPHDGGNYQQAPLQAISKDEYDNMVKTFIKIDYSKLSDFEQEDNTEGSKELACVGGACLI
jgi:ribonucleoside-diphosphate reductase alpha chain